MIRCAAVPSLEILSPLATWWPTAAALARFRTRVLGRRVAALRPNDRAWRTLAPGFDRALGLIDAGVPYQVAAERRHERRPERANVREVLASGATVFLPQAHQVLPRVARLMVALRAALFGPVREECSFLFLVEGRGREGMGLHHDGDVDGMWLQLEGRRTVTLGPAVESGSPEELDAALARPGTRGWQTLALPPGSLLYLPARTPHRVVCHERSLALTFTWGRRQRAGSTVAQTRARTDWDVTSGHADPWPPARSRSVVWTQVPVALATNGSPRRAALWTQEGAMPVSADARRLAARLGAMPRIRVGRRRPRAGVELVARGVLADEELPLVIRPENPGALDGWRFA